MAEWLFDQGGRPNLIHDGDCVRSSNGAVVAWINGVNVHDLNGRHRGWFEKGVLYDANNRALAFLPSATGYLPYRPGLHGSPGMPGFHGRPGRAGLSGVPGRAGLGSWSTEDVTTYF